MKIPDIFAIIAVMTASSYNLIAQHTITIEISVENKTELLGYESGENAVSVGFSSSAVGNVELVWSKAHRSPAKYGPLASAIVPLSAGGYIIMNNLFGSYVNKLNQDGSYEWSLLRNEVSDTGIVHLPLYSDVLESDSGTLLLYGGETQIYQGKFELGGYAPMRSMCEPSGIVTSELVRRDLDSTLSVHRNAYAHILPGRILFPSFRGADTLEVIVMPDNVSAVERSITFRSLNPNDNIIGIFPRKEGGLYAAYKSFGDDGTSIIAFDTSLHETMRFTAEAGTSPITPAGDGTFWLATSSANVLHLKKLAANGAVIWERIPAAIKDTFAVCSKIVPTRDGGCLTLGSSYYRTSNGSIDTKSGQKMGFIAKFDDNGNLQWHYTSGSPLMRDRYTQAVETSEGDIIAINSSSDPNPQINGGPAVYTVVTRLRPTATRVAESLAGTAPILISPNPAAESFTVRCPDAASITVRDIFGKIWAYHTEITDGNATISTVDYASGVYSVEVTGRDNSRVLYKVIVSR